MTGVTLMGDYRQRVVVVCEPIDASDVFRVAVVIEAADNEPVCEATPETHSDVRDAMASAFALARPGLSFRYITAAEQSAANDTGGAA